MKSLKRMQPRMVRVLLAAVVALAAGILPAGSYSASAQLKPEIAGKVLNSVVKLWGAVVIPANGGGSNLQPLYSCSGSIIDPRGYILTNDHCTDIDGALDQAGRPELKRNKKLIVVLLTKSADELPVPSFTAEVVADSPRQGGLDLAVLRITQDLKGAAVDGNSLNLPAITVGSADKDHLRALDRITVIGYPGIGGDTITFTSGNVSGFTYETGISGRAWIKTDALVSGGNSGGAAVNDAGELIGVPTEAGSGQKNAPTVDCRPIQDTNGDGKIDNKDFCVPISNNISAIRPIDLAKPLMQQALAGLSPINPPANPSASPTVPALPPGNNPGATPGAGPTTVSNPPPDSANCTGVPATAGAPPRKYQGCLGRLIFSDGVTQDQQPQSVVTSLPSGSANMIFYFDYYKFEDGAAFTPRLFINGQELKDAWATSTWSTQKFGSYGSYWLGFRDATGLKDGTYKFQIDYDNYTLGTATLQMGGSKQNNPAFNNVAFSGGGKSGNVLPAGISRIDATYDWANVASGTQVQAKWSTRGADGAWNTLFTAASSRWNDPANGKGGSVALGGNAPLGAGDYRLELMVDGKLAATGDVTLAGGTEPNSSATPDQTPPSSNATPGQTPPPADGQAGFGPISFALGVDASGNLIQPGTRFPSGATELFAYFSATGMRPNMPWRVTWLLNDQVVAEVDNAWDEKTENTPPHTIHSRSITGAQGQTLPDGKYELRLSLQGQEQQRAIATIGNGGATPSGTNSPGSNGNPPGPNTNPPPAQNGVMIKGRIVDAYTGAPIARAYFLVLKPGITWATFNNTNDQVLEGLYTDQNGMFAMSVPLERGKSYSMAAGIRGYTPIQEDDIQVTTDTPAVVDLQIKLQPLY